METIRKIRRRRLIHQDSISEIARDLGLSRNTVKKALRSGGEPFDYRRQRQPGTGKTHLAIALARQAIHQGKRARFYSVIDLVNRLDAEKRNARPRSGKRPEKPA